MKPLKEKVCKKCGKCCRVMFIWLAGKPKDKDWVRWANLHKGIKIIKNREDWAMRIEARCSKLKNNRCSIYKNRPKLCKDYKCWDSDFLSPDVGNNQHN